MRIIATVLTVLLPTTAMAYQKCENLVSCNDKIQQLENRLVSLEGSLTTTIDERLKVKIAELGQDEVQFSDTVGMEPDVKKKAQNFGGSQCPKGQFIAGINF